MSFPSNILLSSNAKYFGFVDQKNAYNPHWDITWSFSFALTGIEHGFCTFLTTNPSISAALPGQYIGYLGNYPYLLTETGEYILSEDGDRLSYGESVSAYDINGILGISFDSTGYFALSDADNIGVGITQTHKNSLVIRENNNLIFNQPLTSLDASFFLASSVKAYQTIRCRVANGNKLYVDYRSTETDYKNLATVNLSSYNPDTLSKLYPSFSYSSPISSLSITPSKLWLKNFHTQGNIEDPTYEISSFVPLKDNEAIVYTTIDNISANPI